MKNFSQRKRKFYQPRFMYGTLCVFVLNYLFLVACAGNYPSQDTLIIIPKGWFYAQNNSFVHLEKAKEDKRGYQIDFFRDVADPTNAEFIRKAEAIYPTRENIITWLKANPSEENAIAGSYYFERIWWVKKKDGKMIPFALTADAINQYIEYYKEFKESLKERSTQQVGYGDNRFRVDFKYEAKVIQQAEDSARVEQYMHWYQYCGLPCGWGFEMKREIVFNSPKEVGQIFGDGIFVQEWNSNAKDPYGREWGRF